MGRVISRIIDESWLSFRTQLVSVEATIPSKLLRCLSEVSRELVNVSQGQIHCHYSAAVVDIVRNQIHFTSSVSSRIFLCRSSGAAIPIDEFRSSQSRVKLGQVLDFTPSLSMVSFEGFLGLMFAEKAIDRVMVEASLSKLFSSAYPTKGVSELMHFALDAHGSSRSGLTWIQRS